MIEWYYWKEINEEETFKLKIISGAGPGLHNFFLVLVKKSCSKIEEHINKINKYHNIIFDIKIIIAKIENPGKSQCMPKNYKAYY